MKNVFFPMKTNLIEKISAWLVFIIALTTYSLTMEPTNSWWDCGEYIATAYKLQVGHPPGAPLFLLIANANCMKKYSSNFNL